MSEEVTVLELICNQMVAGPTLRPGTFSKRGVRLDPARLRGEGFLA